MRRRSDSSRLNSRSQYLLNLPVQSHSQLKTRQPSPSGRGFPSEVFNIAQTGQRRIKDHPLVTLERETGLGAATSALFFCSDMHPRGIESIPLLSLSSVVLTRQSPMTAAVPSNYIPPLIPQPGASHPRAPASSLRRNDYQKFRRGHRRGIFGTVLRGVVFSSMHWTSGEGPLLHWHSQIYPSAGAFTFGGLFLIGRSQ